MRLAAFSESGSAMREAEIVGSKRPSVPSAALALRASSSIWAGVSMTRGVRNTMISLRIFSSVSWRKSQPSSGMSPSSGTLVVDFVTEFCARPPRTTVSPLRTCTSAPILRVVSCGYCEPLSSV